MVPIISFKSLQVILIFLSVAIYLFLFSYLFKVFLLFTKKADFITLFFGAIYIFVLKYIIFENTLFWSKIFPYLVLFFIITKYFVLRKLMKPPILAISLIVSIFYPIAFMMNSLDMTYHPYILFLFHSYWIAVFIYCAKKLNQSEDNLPKPTHH